MILRLFLLFLAGGSAYFMLSGWPQGLPEIVRSSLAVLLLVGGLGFWAAKRAKDDVTAAKSVRKPSMRDFLVMGAGILTLECALVWILSAAPAPLEEVAILIEQKFQPAAANERSSNGSSPNAGNWLWRDEKQRALPQRTNLKPGAKPEIFVKLPQEKDAERLLNRKLYVRAFTLDEFKNGVWSLSESAVRDIEADEHGWIGLGERADSEILHEIFHAKEGGGRDRLTALQGVRAVRLPSLKLVADGMGFLPDMGGPAGFSYLASSIPLALEDLPKTKAWGDGKVIQVEGRFSALVAKAAGEGDLLRKLLNIQSYLRGNYRYSLITENRDNLDPLENFLFTEKRGHCEFFATAGALMARELGMEARVAYGWAGGEFFPSSRMFVFRAREAHAWVEVKMEGVWTVMEPTPPVALGGGGSPRLADVGEKPPAASEEFSEEPETTVADGKEVKKTALKLMAVFGALLLVGFLLKADQKGRIMTSESSPLDTKPWAGYFALWRDACEKKGLKAKAGWTLKRQITAIQEPPEFAAELCRYHYGLRYEEIPPDTDLEKKLTVKIKDWE